MNVRIEKTFDFLASSYLDGSVFNNKFFVHCKMITNTMDHADQNIALDRIRHMLYHEFSNMLFISDEKQTVADKFNAIGQKTCVIPGPPVDQLLGIMLFAKLNAVIQERLYLTELRISSELGDKLVYCQSSEEDLGPFEYTGWWHNSDTSTNNTTTSNKGNVVDLGSKMDPWQQIGLGWTKDLHSDSVIEFTDD